MIIIPAFDKLLFCRLYFDIDKVTNNERLVHYYRGKMIMNQDSSSREKTDG